MTGIMEDAQDFGCTAAKGAHALILCRMEEHKVDWLSSEKLDRLRRAHAQKIVTKVSKNKSEVQGVLCKYYQSGKCSHKSDKTTSGQLYKHICFHCYSVGKKFPHLLKDRNKRQQDAKTSRYCIYAVPNRDVHKKCNKNAKSNAKVPGHRFKSRIIYNSCKNSNENTN